jgi:hypothetical protein
MPFTDILGIALAKPGNIEPGLLLLGTSAGLCIDRTIALTGLLGSTYALPSEQDRTPTGTGNMGGTNA